MKENNKNNSFDIPYNDLYPDNAQDNKSLTATKIYKQLKDKNSESN